MGTWCTVGKNRDSWGHFVNIVVEKKKSRVDERGHTSNDLCKLSHFSEIKWMLNQQNCVLFIIARITCLGINLDQILIETINWSFQTIWPALITLNSFK